ncbi:cytochrome C [Prevotella sp. TCVGH]|nr:cytochrome C [Prevotella sp. TCVGH]
MMHKTVKYFVILFSLYVLYLSISVVLNGAVSLKYNAMSMEDINHVIHYALLVIVYAITILLVLILPFFIKKK